MLKDVSILEQKAMQLMAMGYNDEQVHVCLGLTCPEVFANDTMRSLITRSLKVTYNPAIDAHLKRLIQQCRERHGQEMTRRAGLTKEARTVGQVVMAFGDIQEENPPRIDTGIMELNALFGCTKVYHPTSGQYAFDDWGIPRGKVLLLGGESGVGKTRFYTAQARNLVEEQERRVLIFQGEMSKGEYKALANSMFKAEGRPLSPAAQARFLVVGQDCRDLDRQVEIVRLNRPDLVVVDSYNMIHGANTDQGIDDIVFRYKQALDGYTSAWFVTHLNEKGDIKGNNRIVYLSDAVFIAKKNGVPGQFVIGAPGKNRGGMTGIEVTFRHANGSVELVPSPFSCLM